MFSGSALQASGVRSSRQVRGRSSRASGKREGESETVTKGGSRKGIPLNEGEVGVRKEERGTIIIRTSLGDRGTGDSRGSGNYLKSGRVCGGGQPRLRKGGPYHPPLWRSE